MSTRLTAAIGLTIAVIATLGVAGPAAATPGVAEPTTASPGHAEIGHAPAPEEGEPLIMRDNHGRFTVLDPAASPPGEFTPAEEAHPEAALAEESRIPLPPEALEALAAEPLDFPETRGAHPRGISPGADHGDAELTPFTVIPPDRRWQVDSRAVPYRQQPLLMMRFGNQTSRCSGSLLGPNTILTAAHCLYKPTAPNVNSGTWATNVIAYFQVVNGTAAKICNADVITTSWPWQTGNATAGHDWGIVQLACNAGHDLGTMGYRLTGASSISGNNFEITGHPGEKPGFTQWTERGPISPVGSSFLQYRMSTTGGQSGGPIWRNESPSTCGNCVVGVHTTGLTTANRGLQINTIMRTAIEYYRSLPV